jgi:hypothetical protein
MRQIGLHKPVAGVPRVRGGRIDRGRRRVLAQFVARFVEHFGIAAIEHEAIARERDRGGEQGGARTAAPMFARIFHPRDTAGNPRRQPAARRFAGNHRARLVEIHVRARCARRGFAKIDEMRGAIGQPHAHEPAAAQISRLGKGDRERIADRDRRIDRIAALAQDREPRLGRQPVRADYHGMIGRDRLGRGRHGQRCQCQHARRQT